MKFAVVRYLSRTMVQEKLGRVVPVPVLDTMESFRLVPVSWNFSTPPELTEARKLFEIGTIKFAVLALKAAWLPATSAPLITARNETAELPVVVVVTAASYWTQ